MRNNLDETIYYSDHSDDDNTNIAPLRRSERSTKGKSPKRLINEINLAHNGIKKSKSYSEAMNNPFKDRWITTMQEEISSLENNQTWKLSELPHDRQPIGCKWIYKMKRNVDGISKWNY